MSQNVFFSIIVVCLNAGDELIKTVDSVRHQTCTDYEILVKDGGSKDGSLEKLPQEERIQTVVCKDKSIYDAMNQASTYAKGRYVLYLNCGDYLADETVLEQVKKRILENGEVSPAEPPHGDASPAKAIRANARAAKDNPTAKDNRANARAAGGSIYYGDIIERKTGQKVASNPRLNEFALYRNIPCHQACFYSLDLIHGRTPVYDTDFPVRADYEHFLWCCLQMKAQTHHTGVTVCSYEGGGFSETGEHAKKAGREHKAITARYMSPGARRKYKMIMILTLQPLRKALAGSKTFAGLYQGLKRRVYK